MDVKNSSGSHSVPEASDANARLDAFFLISSITFFATAVISCLVPQLMSARPLFFGMLISLITHKLLGGIGEGEVTDFKSAIGNIRVSGPIAVLFFTILSSQIVLSMSDKRPVARIKPGERELTIFSSEEAKGAAVSVSVNNDPPQLELKPKYDSLFMYFIQRCYLDKSSGCKTPMRFVVNDKIAKPGIAIICNGSISGVRVTISGMDAGSNSLDSPMAVSLYAEPSCSYTKNTLLVSQEDALKANIRVNRKGEGEGFVSPYLGQIRPPN